MNDSVLAPETLPVPRDAAVVRVALEHRHVVADEDGFRPLEPSHGTEVLVEDGEIGFHS